MFMQKMKNHDERYEDIGDYAPAGAALGGATGGAMGALDKWLVQHGKSGKALGALKTAGKGALVGAAALPVAAYIARKYRNRNEGEK